MNIKVYSKDTQLSTHFNSKEFKCPHCGISKISIDLINKVEELITMANAKKCIVSSGYRCPQYDITMNGFLGKHSESIAIDCSFYDQNNKIIPSKVMCCLAYDLGFKGIAYIDNNYIHLDIRTNNTYYGDETRGNSSYWTNPYKYFNLTKEDINKYTNNLNYNYQSHGINTKWYPNVSTNEQDYAGVFGIPIDMIYIDNLTYRVKTKGKWLPEVVGRKDYAGIKNSPITDIAIKGNVKYRVHNKTKNYWLSYVDGNNYNINDSINGYAGNGSIIDAIEIKRK